MKQVLTLLFFLILLGSCSNNHTEMLRLTVIDSLMEKEPQAAYDSLRKDSCMFFEIRQRAVRMKFRLLMAKAQNKLYLQMPSDSLFQEVVDYYEDKGDANEKMMAHYLMGCIYRDLGEAPKAMLCYRKATNCVDTLSKNCNYTILSCVYGQIASIYKMQNLHQETILACRKYSKYAALAKDKNTYVQGMLHMASEYFELGDTLQAVGLIKKCNRLYRKYGMYQKAAQVYPKLIYFYLYRKQYEQAHHYMNIFEKETGLFDSDNHIMAGYEHYYKAKGMYFIGINQVDSAEIYYRKLAKFDFPYETARGLLAVYRKLQKNDSIMKYSEICEQEMDKILNKKEADAVVMASSMYNYSRLQKMMDDEILRKTTNRYMLVIIGMGILLCFVCFCWRHEVVKKKLKNKIIKLNKDNSEKDKELQKTHGEITTLLSSLSISNAKIEQIDLFGKKNALKNSKIALEFKKMSFLGNEDNIPNSSDWKMLEKTFKQYHPLLFDKWKVSQLSEQEVRVCMLTYLDIENRKIAALIQTSASVVSNAKKKANRKIYGSDDASSLYQNMQKE